MLDLYKLEIFARVVQAGSFSKAAEQLLMTQSGVSQHMQDLEARLGSALFVRGRRGVTPTAAGETLYGYTRRLLQLVAEAELAVTDVQHMRSGQMLIGATPGVSSYLLPGWIQAFQQSLPHLTISLRTNVTHQIMTEVLHRQLALGVVEGELDVDNPGPVHSLMLQEVEQCVVVGHTSPWWDWACVPLAALDGQPFVMRQARSQSRIWLDQQLQQQNILPQVIGEFDNLESIKRMVISGACVSILPAYVLRDELERGLLRALPIAPPLRRTLKLLWHSDELFSPVARAFLAHLSQTFPQIQTMLAATDQDMVR